MNGGTEASFQRWNGDTLILRLRVQPRSTCNALGKSRGDRLKVHLMAPPVDGKANAALIAFLADTFDVPKSQVHIRRGELGQEKEVGVDAPTLLPPPIRPSPP